MARTQPGFGVLWHGGPHLVGQVVGAARRGLGEAARADAQAVRVGVRKIVFPESRYLLRPTSSSHEGPVSQTPLAKKKIIIIIIMAAARREGDRPGRASLSIPPSSGGPPAAVKQTAPHAQRTHTRCLPRRRPSLPQLSSVLRANTRRHA